MKSQGEGDRRGMIGLVKRGRIGKRNTVKDRGQTRKEQVVGSQKRGKKIN